MVPWEERTEEAPEQAYQSLILESHQRGWKAWSLLVEVGYRSLPGQSLWRAVGVLEVGDPAHKKLVMDITRGAEKASKWFQRKRIEQ